MFFYVKGEYGGYNLKIAILSDVHSNLTALEAVLEDAKKQKIDQYFSLGDQIGYGPKPQECWDIIKKICLQIVQGNHEDAVANPYFENDLSRYAVEGVRFSRRNISKKTLKELDKLPTKIFLEELDMVLCHGSFNEPSNWNYVLDSEDAEAQLKICTKRICVLGHSHSPFIYGSKGKLYGELPNTFPLTDDERFIINVGSVGQPRDEDCRSSYGIFEIKEENGIKKTSFTLQRVSYDIDETVKQMNEAKISSYLSKRLYEGK
jgi:predicted phosphodiesterase